MAATSLVPDSVSPAPDDDQDFGRSLEVPDSRIRNFFRSVEHEIARDHEACRGCFGIREFLESAQPEPTNGCYRFTLPDLINNSQICWFCRFLCRVLACFLDDEKFEDCWIKQIPVDIFHMSGLWEDD